MGKKGWTIVAGAAAIVVFYFSWTWFLSPEARVERTIDAAVGAAEGVDAATFLAYFADDYTDYMHGDRASFSARVEEAFERVDRLNVTLQAMKVELEDSGAVARFELVVVAFRGDERFIVLGTPFQPELVLARLIRDGSAWKLSRVEQDVARRVEP